MDSNISQLIPVHSSLLQDLPCIVLYGLEDLYMEAYARAMIKEFYGITNLVISPHPDFLSSQYHFEFSCNHNQNNDTIKSIISNRNINNTKHIIVLKNFTPHRQNQLKSLLDTNNTVFIILAKTVSHMSDSILSRATLLRLTLNSALTKEFVKNNYDLDIDPTDSRSLIQIIADLPKESKYMRDLYKLLDIIAKSRNQMDIANAVRDYCYKIFHICIPLPTICQLIIEKHAKHPKLNDIISMCTQIDHNMVEGTRDILCYEQLFVSLWHIIRG